MNICATCKNNKLNLINGDNVMKKFNLTQHDITKLKKCSIKSIHNGMYLMNDVLNLSKEIYKDLPESNKQKIKYLKQLGIYETKKKIYELAEQKANKLFEESASLSSKNGDLKVVLEHKKSDIHMIQKYLFKNLSYNKKKQIKTDQEIVDLICKYINIKLDLINKYTQQNAVRTINLFSNTIFRYSLTGYVTNNMNTIYDFFNKQIH